jgi:hypothetical protein
VIDNYTKTVLTVIALALVFLTSRPWVESRSAEAGWLGSEPIDTTTKRTVTVPRSWGRFVGVADRRLYFEADDLTIRWRPLECPLACESVEYVRK